MRAGPLSQLQTQFLLEHEFWELLTEEATTAMGFPPVSVSFLDESWCLFKQPVVKGPVGLVFGTGKAGCGLIAKPRSGQSS